MRNLETMISKFQFATLETQISEVIKETLDRRTTVFIDPKHLPIQSQRYDGCIFSKKYLDLLTLIYLTWYGEDYFQGFSGYVRYEISVYLQKRMLFPELSAALFSKDIVLQILLIYSKYYDPRVIFGTVLSSQQINRVLDKVQLRWIHLCSPKRIVRRRGYKDKGSLRPEGSWLPTEDWSFDEAFLENERLQQDYQDKVTSIVRSAGDWALKNRL